MASSFGRGFDSLQVHKRTLKAADNQLLLFLIFNRFTLGVPPTDLKNTNTNHIDSKL